MSQNGTNAVCKKCGSTLEVSFIGHLGVAETKDFIYVLDYIDYTIESIIFDMDNVEYITSSCLREILTIRKRFTKKESVRLINCNDLVYSIITTTGFELMIDVSKKMNTFDLNEASWKEILSYRAKNTPDKTIISYGNHNYSWKEIDIYSQIIADDLAKNGVKTFSHIAIMGANSLNYIVAFFAIQKLGAIAVLINNKLTLNELIYECKIGDITGLLVGSNIAAINTENFSEKLKKETDVSFTYDISDGVDLSLRSKEYEGIKHLYKDKVLADSPAIMLFSSGSTGKPKAVLLSTYNFIFNSTNQINLWGFKDDDSMCLAIPMFHVFAFKVGFVYPIIKNIRICIPKDMHSASILSTIEEEKCSYIPLVPTMLLSISLSKAFDVNKIQSLRAIILAGDIISENQMKHVMDIFPNVNFINLYGLSEMVPLSATVYGDAKEHILNTVGRPSKDVEVKIIDIESKKTLSNNEKGEVIARSAYSYLCYYKCDVETQSIDSQGYIHTGDLGFLDDEGYLHLAGRIKEIIIRGGENILPSEVSDSILLHDNIKEAFVTGIPDNFYGEVVGACISLKNPNVWNEKEMNEFLATKIASYKIPKKYYIYEKLPKLSNGKFDRETMKKDILSK